MTEVKLIKNSVFGKKEEASFYNNVGKKRKETLSYE